MAGKQLSYAHGASETPLIYQTIGTRFDEAAARDRPAFTAAPNRLTCPL